MCISEENITIGNVALYGATSGNFMFPAAIPVNIAIQGPLSFVDLLESDSLYAILVPLL